MKHEPMPPSGFDNVSRLLCGCVLVQKDGRRVLIHCEAHKNAKPSEK